MVRSGAALDFMGIREILLLAGFPIPKSQIDGRVDGRPTGRPGWP